MKYYAYIVIDWLSGQVKEQGVETEWFKCKEKTNKVKGSRFKSFPTMEEATNWINNNYTVYGEDKKYYAVFSSVVSNNIFQDYPRLKALIEYHDEEGSSLKYKGFKSTKEAKQWLLEQKI